jgi:hypothetical protein
LKWLSPILLLNKKMLILADMRKTENMNGLAGQLFSGPIPAVDLLPMEKYNSTESPKATNVTANHKVDNESIRASTIMPQSRESVDCVPSHMRPLTNYSLLDQTLDNGSSPASNDSCTTEIMNNSLVSNGAITDIPNGCHKSMSSGQNETPGSHNSGEFTQYFQEGYCKISELDDCRELTEAVTDADSSSSHCEREKPEEDGDNDDMLGGVFAFSEEGNTLKSGEISLLDLIICKYFVFVLISVPSLCQVELTILG